jgi:putative ABC transport system permease protein
MIFVRLAWRNVWRNFRRSLLTILAIAFGLAILIFIVGLADGIHEQMIRNATRTMIGQIQIHRKGYHEEPTIELTIHDPQKIEDVLDSNPLVESYGPRVQGQGLISSAENSAGVMIMGVEPVHEREVTDIAKNIVEGNYSLPPGERKILIGAKLAQTLKVRLGEKLVLLAQAADGSLANDLFRVQGIFKTGNSEIDAGVVYINIVDCQQFFVIDDNVTGFVIIAKTTDDIHPLALQLRETLDTSRYEVMTWDEIAPDLATFIKLDDASVYILILIVFFLVAIGILNTMLMSIFERVREFGIMMAVGTKPLQVVGLVMLESLWIALVSLFFGGIIGALVTIYFQTHGIDLTRFTGELSVVGTTLSPILYTDLTVRNMVISCVTVLAVTLIVAVYPAFKAARLQPVEAIRYV